MGRGLLLFVATMLMAGVLPGVAHAQLQVSRSPASAPTLGPTIRGSAPTTFSVSTGGAVTRISGDAIRLSSASVTPPTITITCGLLNLSGLCALRPVRVTITPVTGSGPARITRLRIGALSGASYRTGSAPAEAGSLVFDLNPMGLLGTATFRLGMDVQLAGGAASGTHAYDYLVTAQFTT